MRKLLWLVPVLFLANGMPRAYADTTYDVTFTCSSCAVLPTSSPVTFAGPTFDINADGSTATISFSNPADLASDSWGWTLETVPAGPSFYSFIVIGDNHNADSVTDYSSATTLSPPFGEAFSESGGISFTPAATTPEPGSVILILMGMGFMLVMRERIRLRHHA
jgi:hypothetical protein